MVSYDDPGLPINTYSSYTYMTRRVSARCVSVIAIYIRSHTKVKIQTSKRFTKDYVLNFYHTITLSLLSTPYGHIYFVHRICLNDFIYTYMLKLINPVTFLDCHMYIFVSYIIICTFYNDRLRVK